MTTPTNPDLLFETIIIEPEGDSPLKIRRYADGSVLLRQDDDSVLLDRSMLEKLCNIASWPVPAPTEGA